MHDKKKILFPFYGDSVGGSHLSALTLIKYLKKEYNVEIVINSKKQIKDFFDFHGLKYKYFNIPSYNGNTAAKYIILLPFFFIYSIVIFLKFKPDIIHINDIRTLLTFLPLYLIYKDKFLYHNRNPLPKNYILKHILKNSKIITISQYLQKKMNKQIKTSLIYNPVEINNINKDNNKEYLDNIKIGFFGNFSKKKRPDIFIEIASDISKIFKTEFLMMGRYTEDEFKKITKQIDKYKLREKVKIYNFSFNHYFYMSKCDYIIACSDSESFGRIPLEAGLLRVPVIAFNNGGYSETIKHLKTGILVDNNNKNEYVNAIIKLENNINLKNSIIENAHLSIKKYFSSQIHYKKIKEFYEKNYFNN